MNISHKNPSSQNQSITHYTKYVKLRIESSTYLSLMTQIDFTLPRLITKNPSQMSKVLRLSQVFFLSFKTLKRMCKKLAQRASQSFSCLLQTTIHRRACSYTLKTHSKILMKCILIHNLNLLMMHRCAYPMHKRPCLSNLAKYKATNEKR